MGRRKMWIGERVRVFNNIRVFELMDGGAWTYSCLAPDDTILERFSGTSKESALAHAINYAKKQTDYAVRSAYVREKNKGSAITVCFTYDNLLYLLSVIPRIDGNSKIIKKIEDGLQRSIKKKQDYYSRDR